jgi:hypothetical protein
MTREGDGASSVGVGGRGVQGHRAIEPVPGGLPPAPVVPSAKSSSSRRLCTSSVSKLVESAWRALVPEMPSVSPMAWYLLWQGAAHVHARRQGRW